MAKLCVLRTKTTSLRMLMVPPFIKQLSLQRFISRAMTEIWITSIVQVKKIQGFCVFWSVFYDGIHEQFSVWAFTFSGFEVRWLKKVQVAWFASPWPVLSRCSRAWRWQWAPLASSWRLALRVERERAPVSVECFAQVALLHNAIVLPGYTAASSIENWCNRVS